jgi:hypothetical protein
VKRGGGGGGWAGKGDHTHILFTKEQNSEDQQRNPFRLRLMTIVPWESKVLRRYDG